MKDTRLYLGGMLAVICVGCGGATSAYHDGEKAELRKDYDTALVDYEKAVKQHPDDARYLIAEKKARDAASFFHLKQGRRFLEAGRLDQAAGEFDKAAAIDPSNDAARQELARVLAKQAAAKKEHEKELKQAMKTEEVPSSPTLQLKPFSPEPIAHIRISADSKKVFETLTKLGDLNVAFVEGFQPKPISLDLTNIKLEDALRIAGYQTRTFWKPITPNTILVIPDNAQNHREFDDLMVKTIYLDNPVKPTDRNQIVAVLKSVLGMQKVVDNPDANAIIVADAPSKVEAAEKLIHSLDHGKAEVLVEVAIVEADRDRLKDLGLSLQTLSVSGAPEGAIAGVGFTPANASSTSPAAVTLNSLKGLSGNDFSIALPSAVATAMMSDTHTRILQNPTIRATDGESAKLKIGTSVPIAMGSFLPSYGGAIGTGTGTAGTSAASAGIGLLAETQFQYKDVGVSLDITPSVLPDGEVSLKTKIEISAEGAPVNIAGINEPTFTQKNIEHVIRLKEGEASLLGGLNETTVTHSVSGLPFLSNIPLLRYLFSNDHTEVADNEVMVMLTPHVVRLPDVRESNTLVVGSSSAPGLMLEPNPLEAVPQAPGFPQQPQ